MRIFAVTDRRGQLSTTFPNFKKKYFADKYMVGYAKGKTFEAIPIGKEGAIVKAITFFMTDNLIHGISVKMTNDVKDRFGKTVSKENSQKFIFQKWERITCLTIGFDTEDADPKRDGCLTYIKIQTDAERTFEIGTYKKGKKHSSEYKYEVGSGICCGIFGYHGQDTALYSIGFAMLNPIECTILSNIEYIDDTNHKEIIPEVIKTLEFTNNSNETQQEKYKISAVETTTQTWNSGWTVGGSATLKAQGGIPGNVVTLAGSVTASGKITRGELKTNTNTATHEYEWTLSIPPKKRLTATGRINNTKLETNFIADMKVILENGQEVCYKEKGSFTETSRKAVWLEVNEEDIKEKKG